MQATPAIAALLDPFAASQGGASGVGQASGFFEDAPDSQATNGGQFGDALAAAMAAVLVSPAPIRPSAAPTAEDESSQAVSPLRAQAAPAAFAGPAFQLEDAAADAQDLASATPDAMAGASEPGPQASADTKAARAAAGFVSAPPSTATETDAPALAKAGPGAPAATVQNEPAPATTPLARPGAAVGSERIAPAPAQAQPSAEPSTPHAGIQTQDHALAPVGAFTPDQTPAQPSNPAAVHKPAAAAAAPASHPVASTAETPSAKAEAVPASALPPVQTAPASAMAAAPAIPAAAPKTPPTQTATRSAKAEAAAAEAAPGRQAREAEAGRTGAEPKVELATAGDGERPLPSPIADDRPERAEAQGERPTLSAGAHAAAEHRAVQAPVIETPRATSQTVALFAAQIAQKIEGKSTRFDVQLDPHGLGKVDVRVEITARGEVSAALTFENPQAASELRGRAGELQAALEQAGFDLSRTSLSFSSGGQGQQGLFDQQQHNQPVWRGRAFTDLSDTPETAPAPVQRRAAAGGVDVRI